MTPQELTKQYIPTARVMQLASCADGKPYVVNVHYYSDEEGNLYWVSFQGTRHSRELEANPNACAVIKVHEDTSDENWIIGISIEGTTEYLGSDPGPGIAEGYQTKLDKPQQLMDDVKAGIKPLGFYRLKQSAYSLFDTKNFPKEPKQEWKLG